MEQIRFDDIDALNAAASDEFGSWGPPVKVTQDMVDAYADLTGDHQWIHSDVERAKRDSPFGGTIAHGFLTLSLLPAMGAQTIRITGQSSAVNYGAEKLRFLAPVPIPSEVHARGRLVRAEARPKGTLVTTEADVSVVDADKPSLLYTMQVLYLP
ncbi:MAG TPA: MaoC family dehydratase [Acidimicrobiales bacterium]|nr:MaoC family dehydratase [Acidimicrobiales bacterium]